MLSWSEKIKIIGVNPWVGVPEKILNELFRQTGKTKGAIPVKGKLNGKNFIQHLVKYQGKWRLYLNGMMRKAAGIDVGDTAKVEIEFDAAPRIIPMHPKLKTALKKNKIATAVFEKLSPSRRKEIVRYINHLKTKESVERNIAKVISHLNGKEKFAGRE